MFLVHDINFHRGIAAASGNPIVASLVEMVSLLYYERRRATAERAVDRDLRDAADSHRQIYQAVRARDVDAARRAMDEHLAPLALVSGERGTGIDDQVVAPRPPQRRPERRARRRTCPP